MSSVEEHEVKKSKSDKKSSSKHELDVTESEPSKKRKVEVEKTPVVEEVKEVKPAALTAAEYVAKHQIKLSETGLPEAQMDFDDLPSQIKNLLLNAGYTSPTPIQAQSWPILQSGRDIVAVAKTGSGKTAGFLIPAIMHIQQRRERGKYGDSPIVLILSPTRELANQIESEAIKFCAPLRLRPTCVYGGVPRGPQIHGCRQGADIVIATPGRLLDFQGYGQIMLNQISYLVLDEADRMLDMGFEDDMRKIIKVLAQHQTVFFTATWPKEVRKIASEFSNNAVQLHIGDTSNQLVANTNVKQVIHMMSEEDKPERLRELMAADDGMVGKGKTIIFTRTKRNCDWLARELRQAHFSAQALHGDMEQRDRDWVLAEFRAENRLAILVATDVAARGLDVKDIKAVVNYDFPGSNEDYIHRIGRTGRVDAHGIAHSFFTESANKANAAELVKILKNAKQEVPPALESLAARRSYGKSGSGNRWGGRGPRGGSRGGYGGGSRGGYGGGFNKKY